MVKVSFIFCAIFFVFVASAARKPLRERPHLTLIDHQPCEALNDEQETIIFPSFPDAELETVKGRRGCYRIGGTIEIAEKVKGPLQLYVQMSNKPITSWENNERYRAKPKVNMPNGDKPKKPVQPTPCQNYGPDGCGGYGSCVYCNECDGTSKERKNVNGRKTTKDDADEEELLDLTEAVIEVNGKKIDCDHDFKIGRNKKVYLRFCLPTKKEFLKYENIDPELWDELKEASDGKSKGIDVFMKIYILNFEANIVYNSLLLRSAFWRKTREVPPSEVLPWTVNRQMVWNKKILKDREGWIGCHSLHGTISID